MSTNVLVGTSKGVFMTQDYRRSPDGRWSSELVKGVAVTFEEYIRPTPRPEPVVIHAPADVVANADVEIPTSRRRVYLKPTDFAAHGFTASCPGCIRLQQGGGIARNHTEA